MDNNTDNGFLSLPAENEESEEYDKRMIRAKTSLKEWIIVREEWATKKGSKRSVPPQGQEASK